MPWVDTHCHIPYEGVGEDAIAEARAAGVTRLVTIGTDAEKSRAAIAIAHAHADEDVWATVGLHPHDASQGVATIETLVTEDRVIGIGECGLDYHYDYSPRDAQREAFARQIELAHRHDLTLVIHTREAWDDTFTVLAAEGVPARTVFHCFTGGAPEARRALDVGGYLSFSGIVTFKNAEDVRDAARLCPTDRLLVETDSPYLTPAPHRGTPNRPAFVPLVGAGLAAARGVDPSEIEALTWANAAAAFRLPAS